MLDLDKARFAHMAPPAFGSVKYAIAPIAPAFLVIAVGLTATGLYFNDTWIAISRAWLEWWARHML